MDPSKITAGTVSWTMVTGTGSQEQYAPRRKDVPGLQQSQEHKVPYAQDMTVSWGEDRETCKGPRSWRSGYEHPGLPDQIPKTMLTHVTE